MPETPRRYVGQRVLRVEDPGLLRGGGRYGGDLVLPGALEVAFLRSPIAHGIVRGVDAGAARALPGVAAAFGAADLDGVPAITARLDREGFLPTPWPALARERVRYAGEPVAVVAAESRYAAEDALDAIDLRLDPLPAVTSAGEAARDDVLVHPERGTNLLWETALDAPEIDDALRASPVRLRFTVRHDRAAGSPIEPRTAAAAYDGRLLTIYAGTQVPHILRRGLAETLGLDEARVRVVVPDVGGGFGQKMHLFPEEVAVAHLALHLDRPVRWVEDRRENLIGACAGRDQAVEVEVGAGRDGTLRALRATILADAGAYHVYPHTAALEPLGAGQIMPGPYRVPVYAYHARAYATNKPPVGALRGVGMVVGVLAMERALDRLAAEVGLDPAEVRRRNLVAAMPHRSPAGLRYDSGDFRRTLDAALDAARYDERRARQAEARAAGRCVGIGIASYTEYTGVGPQTFARRGMIHLPGHDAGLLRVSPDGAVDAYLSSPSQGQGHETTFAQLIADELGVPFEAVRVRPADTAVTPEGSGTFASRSSVSTAGAAALAARALRRKILETAAGLLEASPGDLALERGVIAVRGVPGRGITLAEVAARADGLEAVARYDPPPSTFSNAAHVAVVEVEPETGRVAILDYTVAEDCGPVINPAIVEGQIHGAVAEGVGEALLEALVYDGDGQPLAATLLDYLLPTAREAPPVRIAHLETAATGHVLGFKGMGEGGTIGAPAALLNAVCDALAPLGVEVDAVPITPQRLFERIRERTP